MRVKRERSRARVQEPKRLVERVPRSAPRRETFTCCSCGARASAFAGHLPPEWSHTRRGTNKAICGCCCPQKPG